RNEAQVEDVPAAFAHTPEPVVSTELAQSDSSPVPEPQPDSHQTTDPPAPQAPAGELGALFSGSGDPAPEPEDHKPSSPDKQKPPGRIRRPVNVTDHSGELDELARQTQIRAARESSDGFPVDIVFPSISEVV